MREKAEKLHLLLELAQQQRSVVTTAQINECGFSPAEHRRLATEGWLRQIRDGAWAVGGRAPHPWEEAVAVGLLGGPGTALSHATASAIHELPHLVASRGLELTAVKPRHPALADVAIHRVRQLDPADVVTRHNVCVTSAARTVIDLAPRLGVELLGRVIDEGCVARLWTTDDLVAAERRAGSARRPGSRKIRSVLLPRVNEPSADSVLELKVIRLLAPFSPFETHYNVVLSGELCELDIAWPDVLVAVEFDGRTVRMNSYGKFHSGRRKDNLLLLHGWKVLHVTAAMDDAAILGIVARVLGRPVPIA